MPLPFLKLPILNQNQVIKAMEYNEIIKYSVISKRTKRQVRTLRFEVDLLSWVFRDDGRYEIHIFKDEVMVGRLILPMDYQDYFWRNRRGGLIVGEDEDVRDEPLESEVDWIDPAGKSKMQVFQQLTKDVRDVVSIQNGYSLEVLTDITVTADLFVFGITQEFEKVLLDVPGFEPPHRLTIEEVSYVMDQLTVKNLTIFDTGPEDYSHGVGLRCEHFTTDCTHWLGREVFLYMESKTVRIEEPNALNDHEIRSILMKWRRGLFPNLELFSMRLRRRSSINRERILIGFQKVLWNPERPRNFRGYDLRRRRVVQSRDGDSANLWIQPGQEPVMHFIVWKGVNME